MVKLSFCDSLCRLWQQNYRFGYAFRYKKAFLENLPVVRQIANQTTSFFEILVDYIQTAKQFELKLQTAYFEQLIDGLVFELYFPDEINAANKSLIKHLGELKPLTEIMTEEEKRALIQSEFDRLYDPTHPVRNHLETLDSVEEVRIIKEALAWVKFLMSIAMSPVT